MKLRKNFVPLTTNILQNKYNSSKCRLFFLDYEETLQSFIEKDSDNIFRLYRPLFDIFGKVRKTTDMAYVDEENHFVYIYNDTTNYYDKYDENGNFVVANFSDTTIENDPSLIVSHDQRTYFAEYNL